MLEKDNTSDLLKHSNVTVSKLYMAQPAAVESRQVCIYDEVDAVRPMESSSIGVNAVVSSSAASQAQLSPATAAESQFARTQQRSGRVVKPSKKIMDLFYYGADVVLG